MDGKTVTREREAITVKDDDSQSSRTLKVLITARSHKSQSIAGPHAIRTNIQY